MTLACVASVSVAFFAVWSRGNWDESKIKRKTWEEGEGRGVQRFARVQKYAGYDDMNQRTQNATVMAQVKRYLLIFTPILKTANAR